MNTPPRQRLSLLAAAVLVVVVSLALSAPASARSLAPTAPGSRFSFVSTDAPHRLVGGNATVAARHRQRIGAGFGLTAMGALPVLLGALLADATADLRVGSPLLASGMALRLTGSALMVPWPARAGRDAQVRPGRGPTMVRVTVGYRQGGVRVGVAGRF